MERIVDASQLTLCEEVGRGGFGVVYRAETSSGDEVAVKQIDLEHELADFVEVAREIQILSECQCPQITRYLGCFVDGLCLWVVMEYVSGGLLFELLKLGAVEDEAAVAVLARDVLKALAYLHGQGKIHRDLKSQNILLTHDGRPKLTDFGVLTQLLLHLSRRNTTVGTPYWMAPEVIMNCHDGHTFKADIWLLGCCVYELRHGRPPLQSHFLPMQALKRILLCSDDGDVEALLGLDELDWLDKLQDFLRKCLAFNPKDRWLALRLLTHPFVALAGSRDGAPELVARQPSGHDQTEKRFWSAPPKDTATLKFDLSTIKESLAVSTVKPEGRPRVVSGEAGSAKRAHAEFLRILDKAALRTEKKHPGRGPEIANLTEALTRLCPELDPRPPAYLYLKLVLREVARADRTLQRQILPSTLAPVPRTEAKRGHSAMGDIERSLLVSWLDKMDARRK